MKRVTVLRLTAAVLLLTVAPALAHEVTYEGTVAAVKPNRFAAALGGVVATLEVKVKDSKKPMVFDITQLTKVVRDCRTVSFAEAYIKPDDRVAVTVNQDDPDEGVIEIRLASPK